MHSDLVAHSSLSLSVCRPVGRPAGWPSGQADGRPLCTSSWPRVLDHQTHTTPPIRRWLVFLPFMRLFWNQIFTCRSVRFNLRAKSQRFCLLT